jgi:two-component sensor histidine kinase/PAS domain-containing protein
MEVEKDKTLNENLYPKILDNAFDAIIYYTPVCKSDGCIIDFTFSYMNDSSFRILKGTREDYIGNSFLSLFPYGALNGMFSDFRRTAETGIPIEKIYYYEEGEYKGWYKNSVIQSGEGIIVYFRNVTEEKELEISLSRKSDQLQKSLDLISNIIESIKDPFLVIDKEYRVVYANAVMEFWFSGKAPFSGKLLWDLLPQIRNTRIERVLRENLEGQTYKSFNSRGFSSEKHYNISLYPFNEGLSIYAQDITTKLKAEQQLKKSLQEKEILLKEIHHRVKNNLQLVASMMNLQCNFVKDPVYSDLLNESRNRISTMALIHKKLYEETNYASINFRSFAEELIKSLFEMYRMDRRNIILRYSIDDIKVSLDYSINIGLIINELITNSMKYAFAGKGNGTLNIEIKNRDQVIISVRDNGIGFPEHIDFQHAESLGMLIVNSLVDQLDGVIELDRSEGTCFIIKINKSDKKQLELL